MTDAEEADRLSRRRARIMPVLGLFLVIQQITFFTSPGDGMRTVDMLHAGAWVLLASVILAALMTGGFWLKPKAVRELMDDEITRANRADAMAQGFVAAIMAAIVLYALSTFGPDPMNPRVTIHTIVTVGLLAALLRFAALERRALG